MPRYEIIFDEQHGSIGNFVHVMEVEIKKSSYNQVFQIYQYLVGDPIKCKSLSGITKH